MYYPEWEKFAPHFMIYPGTRQIIVTDISKVQTSGGFGVLLFEFEGERKSLFERELKKRKAGPGVYVNEKNLQGM